MTYETGLATHGANDTALTIRNEGDVYRRFMPLFEAGKVTEAREEISKAARAYGLREYGRTYLADHDSVVAYVFEEWTVDA